MPSGCKYKFIVQVISFYRLSLYRSEVTIESMEQMMGQHYKFVMQVILYKRHLL